MTAVAAMAAAAGVAPGITSADGDHHHHHHCPPGSSDPHYCQKIPTELSASPVRPDGFFAVLERGDTGDPLAGQTLTFTAGSNTLCTEVTDHAGSAGCSSLNAVLTAVLNLGYDVTFAGTSVYEPSSAHRRAFRLAVKLIELDGQEVPRHKRHDPDWLQRKLEQIGASTLTTELKQLRSQD